MGGTPEADVENLRRLVLEQQALLIVLDARFRGLRHFVLEICRIVNVQDLEQGRPLNEVLSRIIDEELEAKLAKISDDDPRHVSFLKNYLNAAKGKRQ